MDSIKNCIDLGQLITLADGQDEVLKTWIDIFLEDTPALLEQMSTAADQKDARCLQVSAHSLKSQSAIIGALALAGLSQKLEYAGRGNVLEGITGDIACINAEYERVCAALKEALVQGTHNHEGYGRRKKEE
jgi:HPt (histidine-containing phosphotransfer) domain-containing protein